MDIKCIICSEPWDAYGARHGDMAPWEYDLFRKGAGCPTCEGDAPEGSNSDAIAYEAAKGQVFCGTDDDVLVDNFVAVADGTSKAPQWARPVDPVAWKCHGCHAYVARDLDTNELEWHRLGEGLYNLPRSADIDPPESAPYTINSEGYCPVCAGTCGECDTPIFNSHTSTRGDVLYGDTYDPGSSFADPFDMCSALCVDCFEKIPSCGYCGESWREGADAESCCKEQQNE